MEGELVVEPHLRGTIARVAGKRLQELRSLDYHRTLVGKLRGEPRLIDVARQRVKAWSAGGQMHPKYAAAWDAILARPLEAVLDFIGEDSVEADALRHVSPFAGLLDHRERLRIWRNQKARTTG